MPKFILNKLIRDKLLRQFEQDGQVATHKILSGDEHQAALKQKVLEEAKEIPLTNNQTDLINEIADVQQALDDLKTISGITNEQVSESQKTKYHKKGGFLDGVYVSTLELNNTDEWLDYYRSHPSLFPELKSSVDNAPEATLHLGVYEHYKGRRYEVIGVGRHTETDESIVIYRPLYSSDVPYWLRPYSMFVDTVSINGTTQPRFKAV